MKIYVSIFSILIILVLAVTSVTAENVVVIPLNSCGIVPLAQINLSSVGSTPSIITEATAEFNQDESPNTKVFSIQIDESKVGQIIRIDQNNNPDFNNALALLTNGIDDGFWFYVLYGFGSSGRGGPESDFIKGGFTGVNNPDLIGLNISYFLLHVDRVQFITPGQDINHDGVWTDYYVDLRLVAMGTK